MPTNTTNLGLQKPVVDSPTDQDLWGTQLNTNMDGIDTVLNAALKSPKSAKTADFNVTAITAASTTIGDSKKIFLCDATAGNIVGSLPAATSAGDGFSIAFKKTDSTSATVTAMPSGSDKIDGAASYALSSQNEWVSLICDGVSAWNIISRSPPVVSTPAVADKTVLSNISGSTATPSANTLTAIIDAAIGNTQGGILYRGASSWALLGVGTSGQVLKTNGASANPSWTTITGTYVSMDQNYNNVGSFCFCRTFNPAVSAGATVAGSNLYPASVGAAVHYDTTGLTGTWRCLGYVPFGYETTTLFQRIA